jgi:hypothetical protein
MSKRSQFEPVPIVVDGVAYPSVSAAARQLAVPRTTLLSRRRRFGSYDTPKRGVGRPRVVGAALARSEIDAGSSARVSRTLPDGTSADLGSGAVALHNAETGTLIAVALPDGGAICMVIEPR